MQDSIANCLAKSVLKGRIFEEAIILEDINLSGKGKDRYVGLVQRALTKPSGLTWLSESHQEAVLMTFDQSNDREIGSFVREINCGWGYPQADRQPGIMLTPKKGQVGPISEALKDHDLIAHIHKQKVGNPDESQSCLACIFLQLEQVLDRCRS